MNKEQDTLIDVFTEERTRRDLEEDNLRKKLKVIFLSIFIFLLKPDFYEDVLAIMRIYLRLFIMFPIV